MKMFKGGLVDAENNQKDASFYVHCGEIWI